MTDSQLVQKIGNGMKVAEIAKEENINKRTLEKRISVLRDRGFCRTVAQLVLKYKNKGLID